MKSTNPSKLVPTIFTVAILSAGLTSVPVRDAAAQNDVVTKSLSAPFDKVATKLKRQIAAHKLVIVKEVPYQQMVAMVGLKTGAARGFEIFHPRYGKVIFQKDPNAMIDVPLRIVLRKEGGKVLLQYRKPSATFAPYSSLSGLGKELDTVFASIVNRVAK
jgi:uncharacterized protein (DUF302 family)